MAPISVKSGKGELTLRKSKSLVGLKPKKADKKLKKKGYVKEEVLENLGGFQVVTLDQGESDVDTKLDEIRQKKDIDLGTHVYYAEGSDRPMVPTGEIYISFEEGVSEEEQILALEEYSLSLLERRTPLLIVARVTDPLTQPAEGGPLPAADLHGEDGGA